MHIYFWFPFFVWFFILRCWVFFLKKKVGSSLHFWDKCRRRIFGVRRGDKKSNIRILFTYLGNVMGDLISGYQWFLWVISFCIWEIFLKCFSYWHGSRAGAAWLEWSVRFLRSDLCPAEVGLPDPSWQLIRATYLRAEGNALGLMGEDFVGTSWEVKCTGC